MLLIILDGWGHSTSIEYNAIAQAHTPTWDKLWSNHPHSLISASAGDVGLPDNQAGNSEVGHTTLGAGRIFEQSLTRINTSIASDKFQNNPVYLKALETKGILHLWGLLSPGGVHSHEEHMFTLIKMAAKKGVAVACHIFLDGRDCEPKSAKASIEKLELLLKQLDAGFIASVSGRYYAMDRDQRWDRTELAYRAIVEGKAPIAKSALDALELSYKNNITDEFMIPTIIANTPTLSHKDSIIFANFRADRARQITHSLLDKDFPHFKRTPCDATFTATTSYFADIQQVAFPSKKIANSFGEVIEQHNLKQLRIAETEKYAHVSFFFSGGREQEFVGEQRILIPSPKVTSYQEKPEMSAALLTDKLIEAIKSKEYSSIICNYANGDMVGHTGNLSAAIKAAETLDACLKRIQEAINTVGINCLITADHGNLEAMHHTTITSHTTNPVPLVYLGNKDISLKDGTLADIAPTMLELMQLEIPKQMTGQSLIDG